MENCGTTTTQINFEPITYCLLVEVETWESIEVKYGGGWGWIDWFGEISRLLGMISMIMAHHVFKG